MFEIGQKVIVTDDSKYGRTNNGSIGTITHLINSSTVKVKFEHLLDKDGSILTLLDNDHYEIYTNTIQSYPIITEDFTLFLISESSVTFFNKVLQKALKDGYITSNKPYTAPSAKYTMLLEKPKTL